MMNRHLLSNLTQSSNSLLPNSEQKIHEMQSEPLTMVAFESTVEGTELDALENKEQTDRDQLTGVEARLGGGRWPI